MDVFEAIGRRHSYRGKFLPRAVPRDDLRRVVQAGIQAPSGYNGQSTSFVIVDEQKLIASIAEIVQSEVLKEAPAVIVCVMDPEATRDKELCFGVEDYAAAVENMLLALTALGYASVWMDGTLRRDRRAARIGELLGIPQALEVRVLLPVGAPAEARAQRERRPFEERAWFNRYRAS